MNWLVYQSVVVSEKHISEDKNRTYNFEIGTHVRNVIAETKEEAIGKFIIDTSKESFKYRLDPVECFELHRLKTI